MTSLVVGAGPGMGRAIAEQLGRRHGPVGLIVRSVEDAEPIVAGLAADGVTAQAFAGELADEEELRAAIAQAREALGPFSVVVHNASLWVDGPPTSMPVDAFREGLAVGITAALVSLQATVEDLRANAPESAFLVTGSEAALTPSASAAALGVQKAGLRSLVFAAAEELAPEGVHVGTVTIRGTLQREGTFSPQRIAPVFADLARPGIDRPHEVLYTSEGPDWTAD